MAHAEDDTLMEIFCDPVGFPVSRDRAVGRDR
jgi:hypothetical protein